MFNSKLNSFINNTKDTIAKSYLHIAIISTTAYTKLKAVVSNISTFISTKTNILVSIAKEEAAKLPSIPINYPSAFDIALLIAILSLIYITFGSTFFLIIIISLSIPVAFNYIMLYILNSNY